MALWDEARQKSEALKTAQQEQDEREHRKAEEQREQVKAQVQAVAEFVEAMKRLRIKPVKRHLAAPNSGRALRGHAGGISIHPANPEKSRTTLSRRKGRFILS